MKKLFFLLLITVSVQCKAQYVFTKLWDKTLGGNNSEALSLSGLGGGLIKSYLINDGRILICGTSFSPISGDKTQANWSNAGDAWFVAVNGSTGQKVWDRHYGGLDEDQFKDLTPIGNNRHLLLLAAFNYSSNGIGGDFTVPYTYAINNFIKIRYLLLDSTWNVTGDRLWAGDGSFIPNKILGQDTSYCLLLEGNFLYNSDLVDTTCINNFVGNPSKMAVICYDSAGNLKWDKPFGPFGGGPRPVDIISNGNGYLILSTGGGVAPDCDLLDTSLGGDVCIYSVDSVGNVLWQRFYGGVSNEKADRSLIKTSDGNFLFVATSSSPVSGEVSQPNPATLGTNHNSLWILKIDPSGGVIWDKRYGGCSGIGVNRAAIRTLDNGYLIGATTLLIDQLASCDISENSFGEEDYWLLKLDSMGNKQWDKRWGGSGADGLYEVMQMPDGSYIAAGASRSDSSGSKTENNRDNTLATSDYWIVRFRADKVIGINEFANDNVQLTIMPNPVNALCSVTCPVDNATLMLYDITGRKMLQQNFNQKVTLDVSLLNSGIYILEIIDPQGRSLKGKIMKE